MLIDGCLALLVELNSCGMPEIEIAGISIAGTGSKCSLLSIATNQDWDRTTL